MVKKALVLAGGGALGAYEVGVVEVLFEMGYKFDIVTGTSIGALNAAYIVSGQFEKAKQLWEEATPHLIMKDGINISMATLKDFSSSNTQSVMKAGKSFIKNGFSMDNTPFKQYVKSTLDVDALLNSEMDLGVVTTRIPSFTGEEVIVKDLPREQILPYLHASSACVPVFPIEVIDGKRYIDGVYHDNLPINFAFNMGAREVVAVDLRLFSMDPLNSYFLKLPNVTYIGPYMNLGSMMDFDHDKIMNNMKLGRLDALKHFKKLRGYLYAFTDEVSKSNIGFIRRVVKKYSTKAKTIFKELEKDIRTPMEDIDYFYRAIELMLKNTGYKNYYEVTSLKDVQEHFRLFLNGNKKSFFHTNKGLLFANSHPIMRDFLEMIYDDFMSREYQ